ncbi:hypothetical protein SAMN05216466_10951 [Paraburkholderia phenazinium]|jgi:hypothetical protein|uniref:Uncharacterized protein n=1 Tax=Paraburkholderia phenazinium TaxID=60549 RepID=A0A1G8BI55_9BURK|nr:hypothetical protein SAMN05216466_10951 [Paraburkholderia phenazinium]
MVPDDAYEYRMFRQERIEDVVPHHWNESTFDRRNPAYGFH